MSIITLSAIVNMFKDELSVFNKGEASVNSGHVFKINYDGSVGVLRGEIYASMKNKRYNVEIYVDKNNIQSSSCTCPRGLFKCHHIAATLIYANKNISKTDAMCSWKAPSSSGGEGTVGEMYPSRPSYQALDREVTDEDRAFFFNELKNLHRFSGFYWLLEEEPEVQPMMKGTISEVIRDSNSKEEILLKLKMSIDEIAEVAKSTVGQRENPSWHQMRFGRVTASNFGVVLSAVNNNRYSPSLFSKLLGKQSLDGVKSIQWGVNHEGAAIKRFEEVLDVKVVPTGLWLHPSGVLGASPDGLVNENAILEVKCPFKHRMSAADEIKADRNYCFDQDGNLKKNHPYYHQIQGQLYILDREICFFVVWTTIDTLIITIERDPDWGNNFNHLIKFYEDHFICKLME